MAGDATECYGPTVRFMRLRNNGLEDKDVAGQSFWYSEGVMGEQFVPELDARTITSSG